MSIKYTAISTSSISILHKEQAYLDFASRNIWVASSSSENSKIGNEGEGQY